ncbi:MAG: CdvA-like protein [Candidatus Bathyarchaeia archaeon]
MVLWKYLLELASKDLEALKRKKQALDDLLSSNRISQQTYSYLSKDISEAMTNTEKYLESLISKMKNRIDDLEKQIGVLEIFLANNEMMYAAGEIDYEAYERQSKALAAGIESMRKEISEIKNILNPPAPEPVVMAKSVEIIVTPPENTTPIIVETKDVEETFGQT